MNETIAATGGTALVASLLIQYLKNAPWASWFSRATPRANMTLSLVLAFLTSIGIHFNWDASTDTIAIVGVVGALKHGLWEWLIQWVSQHAVYKSLVVPAETLGEIRAILRDQAEAMGAQKLPPPVEKPLDVTP